MLKTVPTYLWVALAIAAGLSLILIAAAPKWLLVPLVFAAGRASAGASGTQMLAKAGIKTSKSNASA